MNGHRATFIQSKLLAWASARQDGFSYRSAHKAGFSTGTIRALHAAGVLLKEEGRGGKFQLIPSAVAPTPDVAALEAELAAAKDAFNAVVQRAVALGPDVKIRLQVVEEDCIRAWLTTTKEL